MMKNSDWSDVIKLEKSSIEALPNLSGIYMIYKGECMENKKLVYVGQSNNIKNKLNDLMESNDENQKLNEIITSNNCLIAYKTMENIQECIEVRNYISKCISTEFNNQMAEF